MSKAKFVGKRTLAIVLTIALILTTLITFNIGTVIGSAAAGSTEAITVTENAQENVYFYVPEQIYLAPDIDSYTTQDRYTFQWYVDSVIDKNTHLATPRATENSAGGNFYFYYKNAKSITVTFKYLNQDLTDMTAYTSTSQTSSGNYANQNSTIKLASNSVEMSAVNARADIARTRYTVASNIIDTTVQTAGSLSPYLAANSSGYYIEWTISYVDSVDNITKAVRAYTYVFKPFVQPVGTAIRVENKQGGAANGHFAQNLSWVSGVHGLVTTGSHYPKDSKGDFGLVTFSSSNPVGAKLGAVGSDLYAQFAGASFASDGYFGYSPDNTGSVEWLSTSPNSFASPSFNYINASAGVFGANDRSVYAFQTSPTAKLMVDSSRYSNLNQIPNLSVGMMVTDDEAANGDGAWYVADMSSKSDSAFSDSGDQKNATSNGEAYWNNYDYILASQGTLHQLLVVLKGMA